MSEFFLYIGSAPASSNGRRRVSPKSHTGDVICRPSQFLDDFPPELVEEWNVGNSDPWSDDEPF
jgi:hypothetical protein